ncbi:MAG TPA: CRTAC1 family protein [Terriglobales bacterium]
MTKSTWVGVCATILAGAGFLTLSPAPRAADKSEIPEVRYPKVDIALVTMQARMETQRETIQQFKVFHDFQFTDKLRESGITFKHHAVPDATYNYMPVHYDHGSGMAVADIDGDGLYDIYFVNQVGGNELWKNLGNGKFKDITDQAGVALKGRISVGASFADINNTGRPDLFVTTVDQGNVLFRNDGNDHFTDIPAESGLGLRAHSSGALFFDYDRDGLLDLLVCNVGIYTTDQKGSAGEYVGLKDAFFGHLHPDRFEAPVLYKNLGNYRFKDVTAEVELNPKIWGGDADVVDLKGDGWPDIYFLNMQGSNRYFENEEGKRFVDKTSAYFPKTPWGAMGIKFFDYDNDGRMDLYVTDMHSDMMGTYFPPHLEKKKLLANQPPPESMLGGPASNYIFGNAFYHNLGDGKFEEISDNIGAETFWPWGISVGDVNADGWDDVFVTAGMNFPYRYGINSMLLNNRGAGFLDSELLLGIEPRSVPYTPWFVADCPNASNNWAPRLCDGYNSKIMIMAPKASRSSVIFDVDNDGALDIITNDFNSEPQVLMSDLAQRKKIHWLKVLLVGKQSNREGLGATVRVTAGAQTYAKYNDGKSGYLSQSDLPLYFGLGDSTKIDRVEVRWPSGHVQTVRKHLTENHVLVIVEDK